MPRTPKFPPVVIPKAFRDQQEKDEALRILTERKAYFCAQRDKAWVAYLRASTRADQSWDALIAAAGTPMAAREPVEHIAG